MFKEDCLTGQFLSPHYFHHQMLDDEVRLTGFEAALEYIVPEGGIVLELGGGTGILSYFAARKAARVYTVERQPELVRRASLLLDNNDCGDRVELVQGDAMTYLPPEPVDVVVCDMLHAALLREKQVEIINAFKQRYRARFGDVMPIFVPDATLLGVEPVYANFAFHGYQAPVSLFESPYSSSQRFHSLGDVQPYKLLEYCNTYPLDLGFKGTLHIEEEGTFNALRFVTKNILATNIQEQRTIDWLNQNLILPLHEPMAVNPGDLVQLTFDYQAGSEIVDLENTIKLKKPIPSHHQGTAPQQENTFNFYDKIMPGVFSTL